MNVAFIHAEKIPCLNGGDYAGFSSFSQTPLSNLKPNKMPGEKGSGTSATGPNPLVDTKKTNGKGSGTSDTGPNHTNGGKGSGTSSLPSVSIIDGKDSFTINLSLSITISKNNPQE